VGPSGERTLVKRATSVEGRARLGVEAAVLRALAHPGVPQVVAVVEEDEATELHLVWVGPHSLATHPELPPATAALLVGAVADVVADIHDVGLVHGRITPDHVLVGPDGAPVLTGLAAVARADGAGLARDVADLGDLLPTLVAPGAPGRGGDGPAGVADVDASLRDALLTWAAHTRGLDEASRPTARELGADLRALLAVAPSGPPTRPPPLATEGAPALAPASGPRHGRWLVVAGLGLCAGASVLVGAVAHDGGGRAQERTVDGAPAEQEPTAVGATSTRPSRPSGALGTPPPATAAPEAPPDPPAEEQPTPPGPPSPPLSEPPPPPTRPATEPESPRPSPTGPPPPPPPPPTEPPSSPAGEAPSTTRPAAEHRSVTGERMWGLARAQLAAAWGRPPSAEEVAPYWLALVEVNRDRFLDPADPDLIVPGQLWRLPPPPAPPGTPSGSAGGG